MQDYLFKSNHIDTLPVGKNDPDYERTCYSIFFEVALIRLCRNG